MVLSNLVYPQHNGRQPFGLCHPVLRCMCCRDLSSLLAGRQEVCINMVHAIRALILRSDHVACPLLEQAAAETLINLAHCNAFRLQTGAC